MKKYLESTRPFSLAKAMAAPVRAVRLPTQVADRLERAAEHAGGRGKAVEMMLLNQQLPSRSWFREYRFRGQIPCPARVTLRLSGSVVKKLREVTGRRSLSEAIRLLILYTFTDGAAGASQVSVARPAPVVLTRTLPSVAGPSVARQVRPPAQPPPAGPQRGFEHLPPLPYGQRYACEEAECEFGVVRLGGGMTTRCRRHSGLG